MPTHLWAAILGGGLLIGGLALLPRRIRSSRSVLIHAGADDVWRALRPIPAFFARHAKLRLFGTIDCCLLRRGDGEERGSIWRLHGRIGRVPYWADLRVVEFDPERCCIVALEADSLGTERRVRGHRAAIGLEPVRPGLTKTSWRLEAGLRGVRARFGVLLWRSRLQALLFDQGLRSLKVRVENHVRETASRIDAAGPAADRSRAPIPTAPGREPRPPIHPF